MLNDTIAAISTSLGEAAISVLRVSGAQALQVAEKVARTRKPLAELKPRQVHLADLVDWNLDADHARCRCRHLVWGIDGLGHHVKDGQARIACLIQGTSQH